MWSGIWKRSLKFLKMLVVIVSLKSLTVHILGRMNGRVCPSPGLPELPPSGFSCQLHSCPHHPFPPLLSHHLHPHPHLPHLTLHHNSPLPLQENRLTFPSLTTRKGLPRAHDLNGRLRHNPLPHGLTTTHLSLL